MEKSVFSELARLIFKFNACTDLDEKELKAVRDCIKKTSEFEKTFRVFVASVNIENIKNELGKMKENLDGKLNVSDVTDFKESLCKNNTKFFKNVKKFSYIITFSKQCNTNWILKRYDFRITRR